MRDPHTKESRGFGFVKMMTPEQADAAKEGLQGEVIEGRTLSIEKARRAKPRTPTPGKYFGPPKRSEQPTSSASSDGRLTPPADDFRGGRPRGGGGRYGSDRYSDRYDDRRGYGGRDDSYGGGYRSSRYDDRYDDRGYGGRREPRDDYGPPRGVDRYASRDDRYGSSRGGDYDRRGGGGGRRYEREERGGGYGGGAPPPMDDSYGGSRGYDDRGDYGYSRR